MYRRAFAPVFGLLICACSSDSVLSVNGDDKTSGKGVEIALDALTQVDLGTLGGSSSYAADINNANTVVGWSETGSGTTHAFRWSSGQGMVDLGTLPRDRTSRAIAVLDGSFGTAQILGVSGNGTRWTPVVWSGTGTITPLSIPLLPSFDVATPAGFNIRGDIVGWDAGSPGRHGWIYRQMSGKYDLSANFQDGSSEGSASAVNTAGVVLLTTRASTCASSIDCWRTSLWTEKAGFSALGTPENDSEAEVKGLSLNEAGTVVGSVTRIGKGTAAYRWDRSAGFTVLPNHSPFGDGYAMGINGSATVVGASLDATSSSMVATAWPSGGGVVKLSPNDVNSSIAVGINSSGVIAGWAAVSSGVNHAVIWKASTEGAHANIRAPLSVAKRVTTASTRCLAEARSITSRGALFSCVAKADLKR